MEISIPGATETTSTTIGLWPLVNYFLKLGTIGFGGPAALVGFMHRDLVEKRRWITEDTYKLSLALAQIMPGPLAAQTAIAIGYFEGGIPGATLVGLSFILPSFLMVVAISLAYIAYGGLWWMQALFYTIGATVIAIIAIAAYKLARSTNKRNPLLWGIFAVLTIVTAWAQTELAEFFILAGLLALVFQAWPGWKTGTPISPPCRRSWHISKNRAPAPVAPSWPTYARCRRCGGPARCFMRRRTFRSTSTRCCAPA